MFDVIPCTNMALLSLLLFSLRPSLNSKIHYLSPGQKKYLNMDILMVVFVRSIFGSSILYSVFKHMCLIRILAI